MSQLPAVVRDPALQQNFDALAQRLMWGTGDPEKVVRARIGTLWLREDGGASTTLYVKESGDGTSEGWQAK